MHFVVDPRKSSKETKTATAPKSTLKARRKRSIEEVAKAVPLPSLKQARYPLWDRRLHKRFLIPDEEMENLPQQKTSTIKKIIQNLGTKAASKAKQTELEVPPPRTEGRRTKKGLRKSLISAPLELAGSPMSTKPINDTNAITLGSRVRPSRARATK